MSIFINSNSLLRCFFFILASGQLGYAQNSSCGFSWLTKQQAIQDTQVIQKLIEVDEILRNTVLERGANLSLRTDIVIPIVVHVVWKYPEENISDEAIISQIEALNRDFNGKNEDIINVPILFEPFIAKEGISFCLAAEDALGNPTSGVIRVKTDIAAIGTKNELYFSALGGSNAWNTKRYLNIWVANTGEFIAGFGTFPEQVEAEKQGVVIHPEFFGYNHSSNYNLGRVAVHEIGHYLGLNHIWEDNSNCETDDGLEDTPLQQHPYYGCPSHPQVSCSDADMFMNFMDYVNDDCMLMFTQQQMERMIATLEIYRPELLYSAIQCAQNQNEAAETAFQVYPNPTRTYINIFFSGQLFKLEKIKIYSTLGQLVYYQEKLLTHQVQMDLSQLPSGVYWVTVGEKSRKIIIK